MTRRNSPGPRDRLLQAAQRLSYLQGAQVGVDALLRAANVARRSLYEHFGSKERLIAEVLRRSADEDEARQLAVMAAAGNVPRERLLALFDDLEAAVRDPDFRGCRYLAADLALARKNHPAHTITRTYRRKLRERLAQELRRGGHPRPSEGAERLHLLIEGVLAAGATDSSGSAARAARALAEKVIDA